ncbi:MAG: M23 family metallopeptidase [Candidatus Auribacterota bacterium]|nr:M23 family metallopeptidase [Candidatus Auribacterota bacterium]
MTPLPVPVTPVPSPTPVPSFWDRLVYPTDQEELLNWKKPGVYQPTSSGKVESALYGSIRTTKRRGKLLSSFHEGLDIASLERDRWSRPLDHIYAVAEGNVAYINRIAGNSSYGRYVVLIHDDDLGLIYTLYAHLEKIASGLKEGQKVSAGTDLGVMGHSGLLNIPRYRAHLHFEIGLIYNLKFAFWAKSRKISNEHKTYNGWNLEGINPLEFFRELKSNDQFNFQDHLESIPRAFDIVLKVRSLPDYFQRYPMLWNGPDFSYGTIVISCSENGIPLYGREASRAELESLGKKKELVRRVDREVLGRNGCHLITYRRGNWELARNGERWRSLLLF